MSGSPTPGVPTLPELPGHLGSDAGLQGILAQWNNTNQALQRLIAAVQGIVYVLPGSYTVATLPAATANAFKRAVVTDATVTTFASTVVGGGANTVPVYSDGANWRIG